MAEANFFELLAWLKSRGFTPPKPDGEKFLCPLTRRVKRHEQMQDHQRQTAYWIPSVRGLKQLGLRPVKEELAGFITMTLGKAFGFGVSDEEALLSMFAAMRRTA